MDKMKPVTEYMMWLIVVISAFLMMFNVGAIVLLVMALMIGIRIRDARHMAHSIKELDSFMLEAVKTVTKQMDENERLNVNVRDLKDEVQRYNTSLQLARMVNKEYVAPGTGG